jgi:DNA-directed RNA polymerase subunit RPC12/RpoP
MEKKVVICISCGKEVEVELRDYGGGHIAVCPKCDHLAYNGK